MATTVIKREWYEFDDISSAMLEYMPRFVSTAEIDSISVTVRVNDIIDHRLYEKVGFSSFDEYATKVLEKPVDWFSRVAEVAGPIGKSLADEKCERNIGIHKLRDEGKTQQQIADEVGLSRRRVGEVLAEKPVMTQKTAKPPRQVIVFQINASTQPSVAAEKIRAKFGDEFALALKNAL